jgi:hypothetical protein
MNQQLNEGLDYHDMKNMVDPIVSVDEYAARMGDDSEVVTLSFIVNSHLAAEDLVSWLELGYDFILDASVSEGELEPNKWLVFVEMKRRSNVPNKILEILKDLETLTDLKIKDWEVKVDDHSHDANLDILKQVIITNPGQYKIEKGKEEELNEMRAIAGLDNKKVYDIDDEIRKFITNAGL